MASRAPVGVSDFYPAQQILYSLSLVAILLPAPSEFKKGCNGVILLICWLFASQLILLVNSIVWKDNIRDPAPFWCDLSTAILAVIGTAVSCSLLCINRHLYNSSKIISGRASRSEVLHLPLFPEFNLT
jgi:pheromone a factor receptor